MTLFGHLADLTQSRFCVTIVTPKEKPLARLGLLSQQRQRQDDAISCDFGFRECALTYSTMQGGVALTKTEYITSWLFCQTFSLQPPCYN